MQVRSQVDQGVVAAARIDQLSVHLFKRTCPGMNDTVVKDLIVNGKSMLLS